MKRRTYIEGFALFEYIHTYIYGCMNLFNYAYIYVVRNINFLAALVAIGSAIA